MNLYAVTPTGMRPEGMALLGEYIAAQTYTGPLTWVVVDDCDPASWIPPVRDGIEVIHVRPGWRWKPGMNTQADCMREALRHVPADAACLVLEDDDVYLPGHIDNMIAHLQQHELVGERDARYYNVVSGKWRVIRGKVHASLAATACRGHALGLLKQICRKGPQRMIDFTLWKGYRGAKRLLDTHNVVGIKGLPGRPGIGVGHRSSFGAADTDGRLRQWIGDYSDNYAIFRKAA